ncbi:MAG: hypothetical protein ACLP5H_11105 [Desulfomonilaceae bacterium]
MTSDIAVAESRQSMITEDFFYFFLRLRKERIRKTVKACRVRYPDETPEGLARQLIASSAALSFMGGTLMHVPMLIPGIGQALKLLGFVGGASALTRMHLYLILEIALVYGKDIDAQERVPEMVAVAAATGLAASAPLLLHVLELNPLYALPTAGLAATAATQLIGESAIRLYSGGDTQPVPAALPTPEPIG